MQLSEYGCQFSCEKIRTDQLHKGRYHVRRVTGPSSGSSWQIMLYINLYTCLEPLLNSLLFKFWGHLSQRRILEKNTLPEYLAVT